MATKTLGLAGSTFRARPGVPFKLGCCECGFYHIVIITVGKGGKFTVEMYRDEDATKMDRKDMRRKQWRGLRAECNRRLKALRRKGK